jgi:hypothetical protein
MVAGNFKEKARASGIRPLDLKRIPLRKINPGQRRGASIRAAGRGELSP